MADAGVVAGRLHAVMATELGIAHCLGALIRKPQAFRHSVFRDELFPSSIFRRAWEVLDQRLEPRKACRV